MAKAKTNSIIKRIVDAVMSVLLLFLMAYQVTGEVLHEWIGIGMTVLVILHQILNRKWYSVFFKGKYNPYRLTTTILNILLLLGFALTAFCGMSMSGHAVTFLYGMAPMQFTRRMHLSMSYWTFVLMGLHLGMHVTTMFAGLHLKKTAKTVLTAFFIGIGGIGLGLFLKSGIPDYLFFRTPFAFLDYDKSGWLVFLENLLMLLFWALIGAQAARICRNASQKAGTKENPLIPVVVMMAAVIIGIVFLLVTRSSGNAEPFGETNPPAKQTQAARPGEYRAPDCPFITQEVRSFPRMWQPGFRKTVSAGRIKNLSGCHTAFTGGIRFLMSEWKEEDPDPGRACLTFRAHFMIISGGSNHLRGRCKRQEVIR